MEPPKKVAHADLFLLSSSSLFFVRPSLSSISAVKIYGCACLNLRTPLLVELNSLSPRLDQRSFANIEHLCYQLCCIFL